MLKKALLATAVSFVLIGTTGSAEAHNNYNNYNHHRAPSYKSYRNNHYSHHNVRPNQRNNHYVYQKSGCYNNCNRNNNDTTLALITLGVVGAGILMASAR